MRDARESRSSPAIAARRGPGSWAAFRTHPNDASEHADDGAEEAHDAQRARLTEFFAEDWSRKLSLSEKEANGRADKNRRGHG